MTGCVPNLIFYGFAVEIGGFGGELNADCGFGVHVEGVVDKSGEEVGLADSRIADHDYFEEEVEVLLAGHSDYLLLQRRTAINIEIGIRRIFKALKRI